MKLRAKQTIHQRHTGDEPLMVQHGEIFELDDRARAAKLIENGLAVEHKPERAKKPSRPVVKTVRVRAHKTIHRLDDGRQTYIPEGKEADVSEAVAETLVNLNLVVVVPAKKAVG